MNYRYFKPFNQTMGCLNRTYHEDLQGIFSFYRKNVSCELFVQHHLTREERFRIRQSSDYSPFGVQLSGRNFVKSGAEEGRFGFQGQEEDDEIKGEGNSVNYTFRMHDPRLGRFFAINPLVMKYPYNSPYNFSENRVIDCSELEGKEKWDAIMYLNSDGVINKIIYQLHVGPHVSGMKDCIGIYWEVRQGANITPDPENTSSTFNQLSRSGNHYYQGMFKADYEIGQSGTFINKDGKGIDVKRGDKITMEQAIEFGVPIVKDGSVKKMFQHTVTYTPENYYWYFDNAISDQFSKNKAGKDYTGVVSYLGEINKNNVKKLAEILIANPNLRFEVQGHTSSPDPPNKTNMELSQERADFVRDQILNEVRKMDPDFDENRITAVGYGETKLIVKDDDIPNPTNDPKIAADNKKNQAINRRTMVVLKANGTRE